MATRHRLPMEMIAGCDVVNVNTAVVEQATLIETRYGLNYWDCLILAAALLAGCDILYSEDMQDGLVIDGRMTLANPFSFG